MEKATSGRDFDERIYSFGGSYAGGMCHSLHVIMSSYSKKDGSDISEFIVEAGQVYRRGDSGYGI